jgi:hypothetical protein
MKFNSVIGLCCSINHNHPDGEDVKASDIRETILERLASISDDELIEAVGLDDTIENQGESK